MDIAQNVSSKYQLIRQFLKVCVPAAVITLLHEV